MWACAEFVWCLLVLHYATQILNLTSTFSLVSVFSEPRNVNPVGCDRLPTTAMKTYDALLVAWAEIFASEFFRHKNIWPATWLVTITWLGKKPATVSSWPSGWSYRQDEFRKLMIQLFILVILLSAHTLPLVPACTHMCHIHVYQQENGKSHLFHRQRTEKVLRSERCIFNVVHLRLVS